ncbi:MULTISPECIES: phage tail protein [Sphingobacterium]|uniref:phage tail protein n=1 Tax=Sphingobacterium TaxID=28453 RepID=UPI0013DA4DC7|nr:MULTISPECIES: tail fiber protein [unclassified Sphingobacterium]
MNNNNRRDFLKHSGLLLGGLLFNSSKVFSGADSGFLAGDTPFLSEIAIFSFGFAPRGWAQCNGQLLPINQNQALFSLLGTTFGGDGRVNFALPDLRGRVPMHVGNSHLLGEIGGQQAHTLNIGQLPTHVHSGPISITPLIGGNADQSNPIGALPGKNNSYANRFSTSSDEMMEMTIPASDNNTMIGGSQAHLNMQPFLTLNFCIALQGVFPSPN